MLFRHTTGCIEEEFIDYWGNDIDIGGKGNWNGTAMETQTECAKMSLTTIGALYWTFNFAKQLCWVKTSKSGIKESQDSVSGNNECGSKCTYDDSK